MLVVLRPISHIFTVLDKGEPATSPALSWNIRKSCKEYSKTSLEKVTDFIFLGSKITEDGDCSHEIKRHLFLGRKVMTNLDSMQKHYFVNKGPSSQGYGFSSSHVWM